MSFKDNVSKCFRSILERDAGSILFSGMALQTATSQMIANLSQAASAMGPETAQEVSCRILALKAVRNFGQVEAETIAEAWFQMLNGIGVQQPDRYISRTACRIRARRKRVDAHQRVLAKRSFLDLNDQERRPLDSAGATEWFEPTVTDLCRASNAPRRDPVLREIERQEVLGALHQEIHRLVPEDLALIRQVLWAGRAQSDIARELGVTPSALRSRLDRVRGHLATRLTQRYGDCPLFD